MKKILSIMLVVCLCFSSVCVAFAESPADAPKEATDSMKALAALGVFSDAMLSDASAYVTRGDFAEIAFKYANYSPVSDVPQYSDLEGDRAAYAASAAAYGLMDDGVLGNFRAERQIKGSDVIKALVVTFGFTDVAKLYGTYSKAADKLKICKNIVPTSPVTFEELAQELVDDLRVDTKYSYTKDGNAEIVSNDEAYIETAFDAQILSATVTATAQTAIDGSQGLGEGFAKLGNELVRTSVDMGDYIGCTVECIVRDNGQKRNVIYVFADSLCGKESLTINAEDIESFKNNTYSYYDGKKKRNVSVSSDRLVVINGQVSTSYSIKSLIPENGYITLIDGDSNGKYDIISVYDYRIMIITKPDITNRIITDKNREGTLTWNEDTIVKVTRDGKAASVGALKKDDVIKVYQSGDGLSLNIDAWSKTLKGNVESFDVKNKAITIADKDYEIDLPYFSKHTDKYNYEENGVKVTDNVFIGKRVCAYFTSDEKVAYMEYLSGSFEVGYLVDAQMAKNSLEQKLTFKIFEMSGKFAYYDATDKKVTVDNRRVTYTDAIEMLKKGEEEVKSQLILYEIDGDGKITSIDTPYNNQSLDVDPTPLNQRHAGDDETDTGFRITFSSYLGEDRNTQLCKDATGTTFGRQVKVIASSNCRYLSIPSDPKNVDEAYFGAYKLCKEYFKSDSFYKIESYQFDNTSFAADVILSIDESGAGGSATIQQNNVRVITDIRTISSENGKDCKKISVVGNNYSSNTIYATTEDTWKHVKPYDPNDTETYELGVGDIIWYDLNNKNEISNIYICYDASESDPLKQFKASVRSDMLRRNGDIYTYPRIILFDVYDMSNRTAKVTTENLHNYDGDPSLIDFEYENLNIFGDSAIYIEKLPNGEFNISGGGNYQSAVGIDDIKDYVHYGNINSRIIPVTKWGYNEVLFIINDLSDVK